MKKKSIVTSALIIFVYIMMLVQCSSVRTQSAMAPPMADVSQVPTSTANENQSIEDRAIDGTSKNDRIKLEDGTKNKLDSSASKNNPNAEGKRVLHFSSSDFSLYDSRYDSTREGSKQREPLHKRDSGKLNNDTELAMLTEEQAQKLTLNLSKTEIFALSLVDAVLFENFEKEDLEKKFAQYGAKYLLIAVSKSDSRQRSAFMTQFYQARLKRNDIERAYEIALKESKDQHAALDFKTRLIKNR
jgi:hypothetical protein